MTEEQQKDEKVLAAIIAGAESSGRRLWPATCARPDVHGSNTGYQSCAIGMGLMFCGVDLQKKTHAGIYEFGSALALFADHHAVSLIYARGVSQGFEGYGSLTYPLTYPEDHDDLIAEYRRGYAVGRATFAYLCPEDA